MTIFGFHRSLWRTFGLGKNAWPALLLAVATWAISETVEAGSPTVLYTFSPANSLHNSIATNSDGTAPSSTLFLGTDGNLYGTTRHGGSNGAGSVFVMSVTGSLTNLYSFSVATNHLGAVNFDLQPTGLIEGADGNFYGMTQRGGLNFTGTIFVVSPTGAFTNLHVFGPVTVNPSGVATSLDGSAPMGSLVLGGDGNFYGTTQNGGAHANGTIFRMTPAGVLTTAYSFPAVTQGLSTTNGTIPNGLMAGNDGAFYGTTQQGGVDNAGAFFTYSTETGFSQLASFNGLSPSNNPISPNSTLAQGLNGSFYGTSAFGGGQGGGTIFEITRGGAVTLLHSFRQLDAGGGAALTLGADGNFYGTTAANNLDGVGALFRMTPVGEYGSYRFSALNTNLDNPDGADPAAAPTADSAGNIYGACAEGGTNGSGVVFQVYGPSFIPPYLLSNPNPPPVATNVLAGASVTFSNPAQGVAPLTLQWLKNGTNLTDGGDVSGSATDVLTISPVLPADAGVYSLQVSNTWGAVTSSVTALTVTPPTVTITSPTAGQSTSSPTFAGTATGASLFTNTNPNIARLTNILYSITNLLNGSNVTGMTAVTGGANGASNWTFLATPYPGTNILIVQSLDVSGNLSLPVSNTFFYAVPTRLTLATTGSGTATFTFTNGALLNLGQGYAITANPTSSIFSNWVADGVTSFDPTLTFLMESNLVLTADLIAQQPPTVAIVLPAMNARTNSAVFRGTASPTPLLSGVNPVYLKITNVFYWITNVANNTVIAGTAVLTAGTTSSNWTIAAAPSPGTNLLAVRCADISGGESAIISRNFFYKVPAAFALAKAGNGSGVFTATASVNGDPVPTNGAMLNVGEGYAITAKAGANSTFTKWVAGGFTSTGATLSFIMQPGFTATATFTSDPPVVTINSPASNVRTATAPAFSGTTSGRFKITNVSYAVENLLTGVNVTGTANLGAGTGASSNWSFALTPSPGTNVLTVRSTDSAGSDSAPVSRTFFYKAQTRLTVLVAGAGNGTFHGTASIPSDPTPANGAMLNLGEGYTITAAADSHSLFSNWVSATGSSANPALTFVMQSNLVLTATFITNFYPAFAGTYNGLFFPANGVRVENSGMLNNLVLRGTGTGSATLVFEGQHYFVTNMFDASGSSTITIGPLTANLNLDTTNRQIVGTVTTPGGPANLLAELASNVLPSAEYTVLFSPTTGVTSNSPPGDGYALVTNHAGQVTLSGALADGTKFNQSVPVSQLGDIPVYASLYTNSGLLLGWVNLTNFVTNSQISPDTLTWIKKPSGARTIYTNGFTNVLGVLGAPWTAPAAGQSAISVTNGELLITNNSLMLDYTRVGVADNTITNLGGVPTNSLTGVIVAKTGLFTLSFGNGNGRATNGAVGVFLQGTTNAGGYFLTATNAGSISLQPPP